MRNVHRLSPFLLAITLFAPGLTAQDAAGVRVRLEPVAGHVHVLFGAGGNIGVSIGEDGVFLIDAQYAPLVPKIRAAVAELTDAPVRFLLNTHWHRDHVGGNELLARAGAIVVAHRNVRERMSTEQLMVTFGRRVPPSPEKARPVITFEDGVDFHWNGDVVHVFHVPDAHTDGDAIVHFRGANVVHMGDVFFNRIYPFIDLSSGGSLKGMIAAVDRALAVADDETMFIPGHGPVGDRAELEEYRTVLATTYERVSKLVADGLTVEEVVAAEPTKEWDATWGAGFMKPEVFLKIVHQSITDERARARSKALWQSAADRLPSLSPRKRGPGKTRGGERADALPQRRHRSDARGWARRPPSPRDASRRIFTGKRSRP